MKSQLHLRAGLGKWVLIVAMALTGSQALAYDTGINDLHGGTPVGNANSKTKPADETDPQAKDPANSGKDDKNGNDDQGLEGEPVSLFSGQFHLETTDIQIRGRIPLVLSRYYRSGSPYQGMFGRGWNIKYNERILILATNGNLLLRRDSTGRDVFENQGDNTFAPPKGSYEQLSRNTDGTYTLRQPNGTVRFYNSEGCLTEVRNRNGCQLLFSYETGGKLPINAISDYSHYTNAILVARDYRLKRIDEAFNRVLSGRYIRFDYDGNGRVIQAADFSGRVWNYEYDSAGYGTLVAVTTPPVPGFPSGSSTRYSYYATNHHGLATITDAAGATYLTNYYDVSNRVVRQIWGGSVYRFGYPAARTTVVTNGNGYRIERTFNEAGSVLTRKEYTAGLRPADPASFLTAYTYDTNNRQTKVVYPAGNVQERIYDNLGNLAESRRKAASTTNSAADLVVQYVYEPRFSRVKTVIDPRTNIVAFTYDYEVPGFGTTNGNLVSITYPPVGGIAPTWTFAYNDYGEAIYTTNALGTVTQRLYDPSTGFLLQHVSAFGSPLAGTNTWTYDSRGNMLTATDALGHTTTYQYDNLDRLTQITSPAPFQLVTRFTRDANGNMVKEERQTGQAEHPWQTTTHTYDFLDRLASRADDLGNTKRYEYDANGNLAKIVDAQTNSTAFAHDERDLLWKTTDARTNVLAYAYDLNGNLAQLTDGRTNITRYVFDRYDRLATNAYANGTAEVFHYDPADNVVSMTTRAGQVILYGYDGMNQLSQKVLPGNGTNEYSRTLVGSLAWVRDPSGTIAYGYDALDRLIAVTNAYGQSVRYEYDLAGNRKKLIYPDGSSVSYAYDQLDRLKQMADDASKVLAQFTYDSLSRRTQLDLGNNTRAQYTYDWAGRLTQLTHTHPASATTLARFDYTLDGLGNRLTMTTASVPAPGSHSYRYDKTSQLLGADHPSGFAFPGKTNNYDIMGNRTSTMNGGAVSYTANNVNQYASVGGVSFAYDANGNLISDGTLVFAYDAENRLQSATGTGILSTYKYDALGRRVEKSVNGNRTQFVYDADQIIAEYDGSGQLVAKYTYGAGLDEPLCLQQAGQRYYYHADGLGSPWAITDPNGTKAESYAYGEFGATARSSAATANRFGFTGREYDAETGLYYFRTRYYHPQIGRFLSPDVIREEGGPNLYAYCLNNPVNHLDPFGLILVIEGTDAYKQKVNDALDTLRSKPGGKALVEYLEKSGNTHTIKAPAAGDGNSCGPTDVTKASDGTGTGSTIEFDPDRTQGGRDENGSRERPPYVGLGHEMGHSVAADKGKRSRDRTRAPGTTPPSEKKSMATEDKIRSEHGLTLRRFYYPR